MKTFQIIIATLCIFAAGLILTAAICGAATICSQAPELGKVVPNVCNYKLWKVEEKKDVGINIWVDSKGKNLILTSQIKTLTNAQFICILLHEEGHVVLKHSLSKNKAKNHSNEYQADKYMKDNIYKAGFSKQDCADTLEYMAIDYWSKGYNQDVDSQTHPRISERIKRVRN